jgi:hypothetical protein
MVQFFLLGETEEGISTKRDTRDRERDEKERDRERKLP